MTPVVPGISNSGLLYVHKSPESEIIAFSSSIKCMNPEILPFYVAGASRNSKSLPAITSRLPAIWKFLHPECSQKEKIPDSCFPQTHKLSESYPAAFYPVLPFRDSGVDKNHFRFSIILLHLSVITLTFRNVKTLAEYSFC